MTESRSLPGPVVVKLRELYYSAGQKFGWAKYGLHSHGVGIDRLLVNKAKLNRVNLEVHYRGDIYTINPNDFANEVNKYSSMIKKQGTIIGHASIDKFYKVPKDEK